MTSPSSDAGNGNASSRFVLRVANLDCENDTLRPELSQLVQDSPTSLRVSLHSAPGADPERVWSEAKAEIAGVLAGHDLDHVRVERAEEPPEQSTGGKYRQIVPLAS